VTGRRDDEESGRRDDEESGRLGRWDDRGRIIGLVKKN
jgi:hypothetical protein